MVGKRSWENHPKSDFDMSGSVCDMLNQERERESNGCSAYLVRLLLLLLLPMVICK